MDNYIIPPVDGDTSWVRGLNERIKAYNLPGPGQTIEERLLQLVRLTEGKIESAKDLGDEQIRSRQLAYQQGILAGLRKGLKPLADKERNQHDGA
jgi:hypothetical protein